MKVSTGMLKGRLVRHPDDGRMGIDLAFQVTGPFVVEEGETQMVGGVIASPEGLDRLLDGLGKWGQEAWPDYSWEKRS